MYWNDRSKIKPKILRRNPIAPIIDNTPERNIINDIDTSNDYIDKCITKTKFNNDLARNMEFYFEGPKRRIPRLNFITKSENVKKTRNKSQPKKLQPIYHKKLHNAPHIVIVFCLLIWYRVGMNTIW